MHTVTHSENIIELKDISYSYTDEPVVKHINLTLHRGDYLGIIGPNGAGKSTLLKIMMGLLKPDHGKVLFQGKDIKQNKQNKQKSTMAYVSQKATAFDSNFPATVYEVVSMGRFAKKGLFRFLTKEDEDVVKEALCQVEMYGFKDRLIGDLSGGQQQRVFIARALAGKSDILFLDEPTVGVDVKTQEDFYTLLKKLNHELGITLVLVSHDIDVVANEVTELACINTTLIYHGQPKEFIKENYLRDLYGKEVKLILHNH